MKIGFLFHKVSLYSTSWLKEAGINRGPGVHIIAPKKNRIKGEA
jgi:hypothetical protein